MTVPRRTSRLIVTLAIALAVGVSGCGGSDAGTSGSAGTSTTKSSSKPTYEVARRAQVVLDSQLIDSWTTSQAVSVRPYKCLRKAPRGGPVLAACVKTCQACTISMTKIKRQVAKAYNAAPRYVQRYYHATYLAQMRNLDHHRAALRALADYARVHGASAYAGMAEFNRAKALIKIEDASAKVWQRRIDRSRARFTRYLKTL